MNDEQGSWRARTAALFRWRMPLWRSKARSALRAFVWLTIVSLVAAVILALSLSQDTEHLLLRSEPTSAEAATAYARAALWLATATSLHAVASVMLLPAWAVGSYVVFECVMTITLVVYGALYPIAPGFFRAEARLQRVFERATRWTYTGLGALLLGSCAAVVIGYYTDDIRSNNVAAIARVFGWFTLASVPLAFAGFWVHASPLLRQRPQAGALRLYLLSQSAQRRHFASFTGVLIFLAVLAAYLLPGYFACVDQLAQAIADAMVQEYDGLRAFAQSADAAGVLPPPDQLAVRVNALHGLYHGASVETARRIMLHALFTVCLLAGVVGAVVPAVHNILARASYRASLRTLGIKVLKSSLVTTVLTLLAENGYGVDSGSAMFAAIVFSVTLAFLIGHDEDLGMLLHDRISSRKDQ